MPSPSSAPAKEALYSDINHAVESAHQTIAVERSLLPEEVHLQRVCGRASELIVESLDEYSVRRDRRIVWRGLERDKTTGKPLPIDQQKTDAIIHRYCVIKTDGTPENEVVVDSTWQQFLAPEEKREDLPAVLVGTRQEVIAKLRAWRITDPDLLRTWASRDDPEFLNSHLPGLLDQ